MRIIRAFALAVLASVVLAATACSMQQSTTSVTADSQAAETGTSSEDTSMSEQTKAATEQNRGARSGAFDMVNKKVRLNSGYDMPIMGLGTYSLDRKGTWSVFGTGDPAMGSAKRYSRDPGFEQSGSHKRESRSVRF